jgi:hypothetical protein
MAAVLALAKKVLFSAIEGRVVSGGQPVAGAVLERRWKWAWNDEQGADQATTGPDGRFAFGAVTRSTLFGSILPHEPQVLQDIDVRHDGRTYEAWRLMKPNYDEGGEMPAARRGEPRRFTCHLDATPGRRIVAWGLCTLDAAGEQP